MYDENQIRNEFEGSFFHIALYKHRNIQKMKTVKGNH